MCANPDCFQRAIIFIATVMFTFADGALNGRIFVHCYFLQKKFVAFCPRLVCTTVEPFISIFCSYKKMLEKLFFLLIEGFDKQVLC